MLKQGRTEEADRLLEEQRAAITAHRDGYRLKRLDAIRAGGGLRLDAEGHAALGVALLRDGDSVASLEHFRSARILLEGRP